MKYLIEADCTRKKWKCNGLGETELVCIENSSEYPIGPKIYLQKVFLSFQVSICIPGMWSDKFCQYYVCYVVMISVCVLSVHSQPSERQKGLISDKNVLQRYLQLRTLANKRLHKVNHINGFRQSLGKLDHIYSHKGQ